MDSFSIFDKTKNFVPNMIIIFSDISSFSKLTIPPSIKCALLGIVNFQICLFQYDGYVQWLTEDVLLENNLQQKELEGWVSEIQRKTRVPQYALVFLGSVNSLITVSQLCILGADFLVQEKKLNIEKSSNNNEEKRLNKITFSPPKIKVWNMAAPKQKPSFGANFGIASLLQPEDIVLRTTYGDTHQNSSFCNTDALFAIVLPIPQELRSSLPLPIPQELRSSLPNVGHDFQTARGVINSWTQTQRTPNGDFFWSLTAISNTSSITQILEIGNNTPVVFETNWFGEILPDCKRVLQNKSHVADSRNSNFLLPKLLGSEKVVFDHLQKQAPFNFPGYIYTMQGLFYPQNIIQDINPSKFLQTGTRTSCPSEIMLDLPWNSQYRNIFNEEKLDSQECKQLTAMQLAIRALINSGWSFYYGDPFSFFMFIFRVSRKPKENKNQNQNQKLKNQKLTSTGFKTNHGGFGIQSGSPSRTPLMRAKVGLLSSKRTGLFSVLNKPLVAQKKANRIQRCSVIAGRPNPKKTLRVFTIKPSFQFKGDEKQIMIQIRISKFENPEKWFHLESFLYKTSEGKIKASPPLNFNEAKRHIQNQYSDIGFDANWQNDPLGGQPEIDFLASENSYDMTLFQEECLELCEKVRETLNEALDTVVVLAQHDLEKGVDPTITGWSTPKLEKKMLAEFKNAYEKLYPMVERLVAAGADPLAFMNKALQYGILKSNKYSVMYSSAERIHRYSAAAAGEREYLLPNLLLVSIYDHDSFTLMEYLVRKAKYKLNANPRDLNALKSARKSISNIFGRSRKDLRLIIWNFHRQKLECVFLAVGEYKKKQIVNKYLHSENNKTKKSNSNYGPITEKDLKKLEKQKKQEKEKNDKNTDKKKDE